MRPLVTPYCPRPPRRSPRFGRYGFLSSERAPAAPGRRHRPNLSRAVSRPHCSPAESPPTIRTPHRTTGKAHSLAHTSGPTSGPPSGHSSRRSLGPERAQFQYPSMPTSPDPDIICQPDPPTAAAFSRPSSAPGDPTASSPPASSAMLSYALKHLRQLSTSHASRDPQLEPRSQVQPHGASLAARVWRRNSGTHHEAPWMSPPATLPDVLHRSRAQPVCHGASLVRTQKLAGWGWVRASSIACPLQDHAAVFSRLGATGWLDGGMDRGSYVADGIRLARVRHGAPCLGRRQCAGGAGATQAGAARGQRHATGCCHKLLPPQSLPVQGR